MQTVAPGPVYNNFQTPINAMQMQNNPPKFAAPAMPVMPSIPAIPTMPVMSMAPAMPQYPAQNPVQNIPQSASTSSNPVPEKKGGLLNSVVDIGKTVAGGVAVGAVSGGVVSLLPFDNTELVAASLHDTILDAAKENDTLPENLKNASEPFNMAKEILKAQEGYSNIKIKEALLSAQLELAKALDDETIKSTLSELSETLKGTGVDIAEIPADVASNSGALESLKTDTLLKITQAINKNTSEIGDVAKSSAMENILNARNTFIESIKKFIKEAPAGDEILTSAKTQAKIASSVNLMGKAISFAVIIALITKLFDIMQPKKEKAAKTPENNQITPEGQGNVWDAFSKSVAQGPGAPQNNFNKFMTLG